MPRKKIAKPVGRPQITIDWEVFERLCHICATLPEISGWFKCSEDTIQRGCQRKYGENFAVVYGRFSSGGKISLRRKQFQVAVDGNVPMLIWLGKQVLGQSDKILTKDEDGPKHPPKVEVIFNVADRKGCEVQYDHPPDNAAGALPGPSDT